MPRKKEMGRAANGLGTVRKKTVKKNGKEYIYWEGRCTVGYDPITGKQIQRSISGKTQKEVTQKLKELTVEVDHGTYQAPAKLTLSDWLDTWTQTYLGSVKPRTLENYQCNIEQHIKPELGRTKLEALTAPQIQAFYNRLLKPEREGVVPLSPKTIKNIHGILHSALQQAVSVNYLRFNPSDACTLPRIEHKELKPLDEDAITRFLAAVKGHPYEAVYVVTLFTGMRQGEVLGLSWDNVDFAKGTVLINKQLQRFKNSEGKRDYHLVSPKNGKGRQITPAPYVMEVLRHQKAKQAEWRLKAGSSWSDMGLVFTNELGGHLMPHTVYKNFKQLASEIGRPDARFHDLRHSYAVAAIRSGDDIKTVQGNLGHATAAFTLDIYGHVTDQMKQASAERMEKFIKSVSG